MILRCLKMLKIIFGRGALPPLSPPLGALPQDPAGDLRPPDPRLFRIGLLALLSPLQRTMPKGKVLKVPLGTMPIISELFKGVACDLIEPVTPISENGRYILTVVDFATRYYPIYLTM